MAFCAQAIRFSTEKLIKNHSSLIITPQLNFYLHRLLKDQVKEQLHLHPAVVRLVRQAAALVFEQQDEILTSNPLALRDALLTYVCHDSTLPCIGSTTCLRADHVSALFAYTEWDNHQRWKSKYWRNACLLKAYGMFKNIVSNMLKMASESSPKMVIYSGHDFTLQYLSVALGISNEHASLQYASRLVIEVYKNEGLSITGPKGYYFKLLVNGKDVTKEMSFCHNPENYNYNGKNSVFCRVEDIVRFIHDDYFSGLNFTNFKDACYVHKDKNEEKFV